MVWPSTLSFKLEQPFFQHTFFLFLFGIFYPPHSCLATGCGRRGMHFPSCKFSLLFLHLKLRNFCKFSLLFLHLKLCNLCKFSLLFSALNFCICASITSSFCIEAFAFVQVLPSLFALKLLHFFVQVLPPLFALKLLHFFCANCLCMHTN